VDTTPVEVVRRELIEEVRSAVRREANAVAEEGTNLASDFGRSWSEAAPSVAGSSTRRFRILGVVPVPNDLGGFNALWKVEPVPH
jgi:hypothetical protein